MCSERQQGDIPGLLDSAGQAALVRSAHARQTAGHNLAALGHKPLQQTHIAVRDGVDLLGAELANLLAAEELAAPAGTAAGARTAGPAAGSACAGAPPSGALPCTSSAMVIPFQLSAVSSQLSAKRC